MNEAVVEDARRLGVLVCRADGDDDQGSDFLVPAALRRGLLTVAVSCRRAPVVAALRVRDEIGAGLSDGWVKLAEAMQQIRTMIKNAAGLPDRPPPRHLPRSGDSMRSYKFYQPAEIEGLRADG